MTNSYYEVEYYKYLLFDQSSKDDEFKILLQDPEVDAFLKSKTASEVNYELLMEDDDFPDNVEEGILSLWQVVRSVLAGDSDLFGYPYIIPFSEFSTSMILYATGYSKSEAMVDAVMDYIEDNTSSNEWGPLLIGLVQSGDVELLAYFYDIYLEGQETDTEYYKDWLALANQLNKDSDIGDYLHSI